MHKACVALHGDNIQTGEYNVMGDYIWCSEKSSMMAVRRWSKPLLLVFAPIASVNRPIKVDVTDSMAFKCRKRTLECDCCIGCAIGKECYNRAS
jgi:hypothetical protein